MKFNKNILCKFSGGLKKFLWSYDYILWKLHRLPKKCTTDFFTKNSFTCGSDQKTTLCNIQGDLKKVSRKLFETLHFLSFLVNFKFFHKTMNSQWHSFQFSWIPYETATCRTILSKKSSVFKIPYQFTVFYYSENQGKPPLKFL